jgi:hypothetical protein
MIFTAEERRSNERRILKFINREVARGQPFPTVDVITRAFRWKDNKGIKRALRQLARDGLIECETDERGMRPRYSLRFAPKPVKGYIPDGHRIL